MKIVITMQEGRTTDQFMDELRTEFPGVEFVLVHGAGDQLREIADADAAVGRLSTEAFQAAKKLRWIHEMGTGIDQYVSVEGLVESDVTLTNALGPHANPMADHVFALLLSLTHCLPELFEDQRARRWEMMKYQDRYVEIDGRTMGILALGGIGRAVARRAGGFGMKVYAVDIRPVPGMPEVEEVWGLDRLDDLIKISDVFVITAPYTAQTHHLIDRRRIGLMKPTSYLIAISRGGIVEEPALIDALREGRIAGAGLDVTEVEPLPKDSPLWGLPNVVMSPHASALTPELYEGRGRDTQGEHSPIPGNEPFIYVCDKQAGF